MQFYACLRMPWPALLLLTSHVLATSTCTYACWLKCCMPDMDDDGVIESKGVRARCLATLRKRRQRETDKPEAKRPRQQNLIFELIEITLTLGHLSQLDFL